MSKSKTSSRRRKRCHSSYHLDMVKVGNLVFHCICLGLVVFLFSGVLCWRLKDPREVAAVEPLEGTGGERYLNTPFVSEERHELIPRELAGMCGFPEATSRITPARTRRCTTLDCDDTRVCGSATIWLVLVRERRERVPSRRSTPGARRSVS